MIIFNDPRCTEYGRAGHPERPARIERSREHLSKTHAAWEWRVPRSATREELLLAHAGDYVDSVERAAGDFDADCPAYPEIAAHSSRATGAAIEVAESAVAGERAFSLMRPPGHHALRDRAMGFCYYGHIVIAALKALDAGVDRVAIWDFDAHHGNGTEALVAGNERIAFASIHQYPGWPGTGTKSYDNIHNFPVPPGGDRAHHRDEVERALDVLLKSRPALLLVSAGFDAYKGDPITEMTLEQEDFATFGRWLRELEIPCGAILEGGYSDELPHLIDAFLTAWAAE